MAGQALSAAPLCAQFGHDSEVLVGGLESNTRRYIKLLAEAADQVMPEPTADLAHADVLDVLHEQVRVNSSTATRCLVTRVTF